MNSLTLSTDMKSLILIENNRSINYTLDANGVIVGTLAGQITVTNPLVNKKKQPSTVKAYIAFDLSNTICSLSCVKHDTDGFSIVIIGATELDVSLVTDTDGIVVFGEDEVIAEQSDNNNDDGTPTIGTSDVGVNRANNNSSIKCGGALFDISQEPVKITLVDNKLTIARI